MKQASRQLIIRVFLILFILAIFSWLIPSTIGFIDLDSKYGRSGELPAWLQNTSALQRAIIILFAVQLPYLIIAIALFAEFLKPNMQLKYNKDRFLTFLAVILLLIGIFTLFWSGILAAFLTGITGLPILYDTIIYGLGFGILFLLTIKDYSIWIKILLWARLIEVWGPLIGYDTIPAIFGRYTGGAFGHFGYGIKGMFTSVYFITDFSVQIFSVIGVMYLLRKAGFRWFWIFSFSVGAVITGISLSYILPAIF